MMPIFACRECCCIENTALSNYWSAAARKKPALCSACDPAIGKWHGEFQHRSASGFLVDESGHLWSTAETMPKHYKILGAVLLEQPKDNQEAAAQGENK